MVGEFVAVRRGVSTEDLVVNSREKHPICIFEKDAIFFFSKYRRITSTYDQFRTQSESNQTFSLALQIHDGGRCLLEF
jgi:hypothetical protein